MTSPPPPNNDKTAGWALGGLGLAMVACCALPHQRASTTLMNWVPARPATPLPPAERAKTDPQAPYEKIAAELRREILTDRRHAGDYAQL